MFHSTRFFFHMRFFDEISAKYYENVSFLSSDAKNNQRAEYSYERATRRNDPPLAASSEIEQRAPISCGLFKLGAEIRNSF